MKSFILIVLFFFFYFTSIKDLYDHNKFLMEDVKILEMESYEQDSVINKLKKDNYLLNKELNELKIKNKKPVKVKKVKIVEPPKVEQIKIEQDTVVSQI